MFLFLISILAASADIPVTADRLTNVQAPTNYVVNPGVEKNLRGITSSYATRNTSSPLFGDADLLMSNDSISCGSSTNCSYYAEFAVKTLASGLTSETCEARFYIRGSQDYTNTNYFRVQLKSGGSAVWTQPIQVFAAGKTYSVNYPCDANIDVVRIDNMQSGTPTADIPIRVDNVYFGAATNVGTVQQATEFAKIRYAGVSNCIWLSTAGSYTDFSADSDCNDGLISGAATSPGSKVPQLPVSNLPSGKYRLDFVGRLGVSYSGSDTICSFNLTSGSENQGYTLTTAVSSLTQIRTQGFSMVFDVTSPRGATTFKLQAWRISGGGDCAAVASDSYSDLSLVLYRYPTEAETVVSMANVAVDYGLYGPFNSATCPQGWIAADGTNGTVDMRAMFVRGSGSQTISGVAHSAGTLGSAVNDQFQGHYHGFPSNLLGAGSPASLGSGSFTGQAFTQTTGPVSDGTNGTPRTGIETFPVHRVLTWCMKVQSTTAPLLRQSVISSFQGVTRLESAKVNCSSSSSITSNPGSWVSSIGNISSGACTIAWPAWAAAPQCSATITNTGAAQQLSISTGATSTTGVTIYGYGAGSALTNYNVDLICVGAK